MGRTIVWPKGLLLGAALAAALPRSPCYVHIARACDKEVQLQAAAHPGLLPSEFVFAAPSQGSKIRSLEIIGSWSGFKDRHELVKKDDTFSATLLLPPGKFEYQVYRNGQLASEKKYTLRLGWAATLAGHLPSAQTSIVMAVLFIILAHFTTHRAGWIRAAKTIQATLQGSAALRRSSFSAVSPERQHQAASQPRDSASEANAPSRPTAEEIPTAHEQTMQAQATNEASFAGSPASSSTSGQIPATPEYQGTEAKGGARGVRVSPDEVLVKALKNLQEENPLASLFGAATSVS